MIKQRENVRKSASNFGFTEVSHQREIDGKIYTFCRREYKNRVEFWVHPIRRGQIGSRHHITVWK